MEKEPEESTSSTKPEDDGLADALANQLSDLSLSSDAPGKADGGGANAQIKHVAQLLAKSERVIVMSGAGLSCAAGIPDFRTPGTGLYDNLQKYDLPHPTAVFEIDFFRENPKPFYTLAKELYPGNFSATLGHYFIRLLHEKGKLQRNYTQNIDTLEMVAGVPHHRVIEAHGSFASARCIECGTQYGVEQVKRAVFADAIPRCTNPRCTSQRCREEAAQGEAQGSAAAGAGDDGDGDGAGDDDGSTSGGGAGDDDGSTSGSSASSSAGGDDICFGSGGLVKPDIVFFGEGLPERFFTAQKEDFEACDMLIVMGTSLQVQPFAGLIHKVRPEVPRVLVNMEKAGVAPAMLRMLGIATAGFDFTAGSRDTALLGDCQATLWELSKELGWSKDLVALIPKHCPGMPSEDECKRKEEAAVEE